MINEERFLIAAYGTLRKGWGNSRLVDIPSNKYIGEGKTVEKYTMRSSGIPYLSKEPMVNITVDLWEIDKDSLIKVDALEGHPKWYKRELVPVEVNNKIYNAYIYFNEGSNANIVESGDFNRI